MNVLPGELRRSGDGSSFVEVGDDRLPVAGRPDGIPDGPVLYGIRPEDIDVVTEGSDSLVLSVDVADTTGRETEIYGGVQGHRIGVIVRERTQLRAGDTVRIRLRGGKAHVFDPETTRRKW
jgi:multiple sugar transport system ATP-binding protein